MKIVVAKKCETGEVVFINANRIESFFAREYKDDNSVWTKIFFSQATKCEVIGDKTREIAEFMMQDGDSGILDLVNVDEKKSYWCKKGSNNNGEK